MQNEEVFQKSVLAGTAVVTKPLNPPSVRAHTLMREYSRLISRKNMPVYVCEDLSSVRTRLWHDQPMPVLCSVLTLPVCATTVCPEAIWPVSPQVSVMRLSTPHWSQLIVQY